MAFWRMSFRVGNQGQKMWPLCLKFGVAAIGYEHLEKVDLSVHPRDELQDLWGRLAPTQKASLRRVAYEMRVGDVIYVKEGPELVGKGIVSGPYQFDHLFRIKEPSGFVWAHQILVNWLPEFNAVRLLLGAEQLTVKELSVSDMSKIEHLSSANKERIDAVEGASHLSEAAFRRRNRALIAAKKADSDGRCEACGMSFENVYGRIGRGFIIAHHLDPIADGVRKTTLDDIALLCANCHAMVHMKFPPIPLEDLKAQMRQSPYRLQPEGSSS